MSCTGQNSVDFSDDILKAISFDETDKKVLVIGTEECMYPGLFVAKSLIKDKRHVTFHATTRSPILTDINKEYPLQARFSLESFYEEERVTYIYNLRKYSQIIIISDSIKNKKPSFDGRYYNFNIIALLFVEQLSQ